MCLSKNELTLDDISSNKYHIETINKKLKGIVPEVQIIEWLCNFDKNEIHVAINIAMNLNVFTGFEIEEILASQFKKLLDNEKKLQKILVCTTSPISKYKSGDAIGYYFNKMLSSVNNNKIIITNNLTEFENAKSNNKIIIAFDKTNNIKCANDRLVIVLDDFIGSGDTVNKTLDLLTDTNKETRESTSSGTPKIIFMGIAGTTIAVESLKKQNIEVYIPENNIFEKFSENKNIINDKKSKMISLAINNTSSTTPKGYKDSEMLVSFSHGTPNNTFPIIWYDKGNRIINPQKKITPLIPRFTNGKINMSQRSRKDTCYYLAKYNMKQEYSKVMNNNEIEKFSNNIAKDDFILFSIMKYKFENKEDYYICNTLGLFLEQYYDILLKAPEIFDNDHSLTEKGKIIITNFNIKCYNNGSVSDKVIFNENITYKPAQFKGYS